jgi:hypothetical protein
MKGLHSQKKKEINQKEIELCMGKLKEIEDRVERGVHNMEERRDERVTYLKTQGLLLELKKEQVKKMFKEEDEHNHLQLVSRMQ